MSKKIKYMITHEDGTSEKVVINKEKGWVKLKCANGYSCEYLGHTVAKIEDMDGYIQVDLEGEATITLNYYDLENLHNLLNIWYEEFES